MQPLAQAKTQPNVRPAHVDAKFPPETTKGADGVKYAGNFHPYKKEDSVMS
jgi:hypothetical protein